MRVNPTGASRRLGADDTDAELTLDDFVAFFRDVNEQKPEPGQEPKPGPEPFSWQLRLMGRVLAGKWPDTIDLPTGTGKTAVLDMAVFALAARPDISPRRIVFVIDRRIVVNQVSHRAMQIRDRIKCGKTDILKTVRDRLLHLSGSSEPLGVTALHGGIPIDGEWARRPDQPWIIVSTVDQFGSRLLFRGYGVTPSMRPIHAGLAGNDCLVVLDEVHLSVPFAQTLAQVASMKRDALDRRFAVVEMSATPSNANTERFVLDMDKDLGCVEMRRRVEARKKAELISTKDQDSIPDTVLKTIESFKNSLDAGDVNSMGVVVNYVRTARQTYRALVDEGYDAHMITGRMRPLDRVRAMKEIRHLTDPDDKHHRDKFAVVVATQSIEVGADISFDALITECAAVDSLRQRFGRLDRRGSKTGNPAKAWIIGPQSVVKSKKPDPVYGDSVKATWKELVRRAKNGTIDVGPLFLRDFPDDATAPRLEAPLLLHTHMDAWVQTNPKPVAQPDVKWFLHGMETGRVPDVSIVWRHDRSYKTLRLVPPRPAEFLQIPIYAAKSWLSARGEADVADMEQDDKLANEESQNQDERPAVDIVCWGGIKHGIPVIKNADDIKPGDVLVADPKQGGLTDGTWDPSSHEIVADMGDEAQLAHKRRVTLRLDRMLADVVRANMPQTSNETKNDRQPDREDGQIPDPPLPSGDDESDIPTRARILMWLELVQGHIDKSGWLFDVIARLGDEFEIIKTDMADKGDSEDYYVLAERHHSTKKPVVDASTMDGSDETSSLICTGITLRKHLDGVGDRAWQMATRLGLADFAGDLRLAGYLHDIGKADPRFQAQLVGDDPVDMEKYGDEPLAKSIHGVRRKGRSYPKGMRHEIASVAMLKSNPDVLAMANDPDLVIHLIGTHHGWGRPLLPVMYDPNSPTFSYLFDDAHTLKSDSGIREGPFALDMADRFWRLVERYGYHGLAWLEAILRLADHQQSAEEAQT